MDTKLEILLLEDSQSDADLMIRFLKKENLDFNHSRVWRKNDFIKALKDNIPDLIIADQSMPQFTGIEAFRIAKNEKKNIPFILVTGSVSEKILTEFAKEGVDDYLLKGNLLRLPSAIENVVGKKKIEALHKGIQIAHKQIKDSINYAKIIQDAMQPDLSKLRDIFPSSFVLNCPKDILSGDFYWLQKRDDLFFIALADCTGHGVHGALLAMMGHNLLNEAVNSKKNILPAEVLDRLNKNVRRNFKNGAGSFHNGMDVALCAIDHKNKTMMYAGANRPLLIIRGNELMEIKPDKISIGGEEDTGRKFANQTVSIKTGDRIFIFSDGYADQFHFQTGKKIMNKRLKELLLTYSGSTMDEQKVIITNFFKDWKGITEQVDDMLLIGIQI